MLLTLIALFFKNKEIDTKFKPNYFFEIVGWVTVDSKACDISSFSLHCAQTDKLNSL